MERDCYDCQPWRSPDRRRLEFRDVTREILSVNFAPARQNRLRRILRTFVTLVLAFALSRPTLPLFGQEAGESPAKKPAAEAVENPFPNRHPAADLEGGVEWLNSAGPISIKDLRGKIVLIDFWTFCCINCMHVLPDLAYLEKKYPKELVVIGVHSAKFDNEKETGNIRKAILRYEIEHPVVNDANMIIWRKFGVNSWPSLVVLDPEGQYCGYVSGEGNRELLENVIDRLVAYHKAKGTLDETPVRFDLERNKAQVTALRFPGKILVDEPHKRLFISDSNHNRLVISSLDGQLIDVIGSGAIGQKDGSYAAAEFDRPQGMTLVDNMLFVADTENHLLRTVDLAKKTVSTLAGIGEQNRNRAPGGTLRETALNSPWDLTVVDGVLYIAMAGPHQIWAHKFGTDVISQYAGSGKEDIHNGPLDQAAFAQPSGIVHDKKQLYVVDSEGSAIRQVTTTPENDLSSPTGSVTTIAGPHDLPRGRSLFEFGDVDASSNNARFQHPLGLALHDGAIFVADSYNHKIRRVDPKAHQVTTWVGTGSPGTELAPLQLSEPAGLAIAGDKMYIADTNNHRIVLVDLKTKAAEELVITGLTAPAPPQDQSATLPTDTAKSVDVDRQELAPGSDLTFEVAFDLPEGYKLNELLPVSYRVKVDGDQTLIAADQLNVKREATSENNTAKFAVPTTAKTGEATLLLAVTYGYCRDGNGGVCKVGTIQWKIPVWLKQGATVDAVKLKVKAK